MILRLAFAACVLGLTWAMVSEEIPDAIYQREWRCLAEAALMSVIGLVFAATVLFT